MASTQQTLTLYTAPSFFPNPQRVRLMMLEKGVHSLYNEINLEMTSSAEQKSWQHQKLNPWGETPVLQLPDGTMLAEAAAIARYVDNSHEGRKIMGETTQEMALDQMWDARIWTHLLYRLTTAFHVLHNGLGPELELTTNHAWGEHCRKEALATAAVVDRHLSDGRQWMLGGEHPTWCDTTLVTAIQFGKFGPMHTNLTHRFEFLDKYWQRWQERESFKIAYADGGGIEDLEYLKKQ